MGSPQWWSMVQLSERITWLTAFSTCPTSHSHLTTMKKINILIIFLISLSCVSTESPTTGSPLCDGGNLRNITVGCEEIFGSPLKIEQADVDDPDALQRAKKIKKIRSGLMVISTNLEDFNLLPAVEEISGDGPAIEFSGNSKLKHLDFPKLEKLIVHYGDDEVAISFVNNDNYPKVIKEDITEFNKLMELAYAFDNEHTGKCKGNFIHIETREEESWLLIVVRIFVIILGIIATPLFCFTFCTITVACWKKRNASKVKSQEESSQPSSMVKSVKGRIVPKRRKRQ